MSQSTTFGAAPESRRTVRVTGTPSPRCFHTGGSPAQISTDFTDATPVITEEYLCEIYVAGPTTVNGIALFNGSVASGNQVAILRDALGNVLGQSASTAMSGTDAYQKHALVAPARIDAGTYFIASQVDNTTARLNNHTIGVFGAGKITGQVYGTVVAQVTPPITFTTALGRVATLY